MQIDVIGGSNKRSGSNRVFHESMPFLHSRVFYGPDAEITHSHSKVPVLSHNRYNDLQAMKGNYALNTDGIYVLILVVLSIKIRYLW